jgi:hypothetical protein
VVRVFPQYHVESCPHDLVVKSSFINKIKCESDIDIFVQSTVNIILRVCFRCTCCGRVVKFMCSLFSM